MSRLQNQEQYQEIVHVHYHYHYIQPQWTASYNRPIGKQKLSKSQIFIKKAMQQEYIEKKQDMKKQFSQVKINRDRQRSFEKLRLSNCWSTEHSNSKNFSQQKYSKIPQVSSFTTKEQQLIKNEAIEPMYSNQTDRMQKNNQLIIFQRHQKNIIIAKYQSQLKWYKDEVRRLKMIEEQCIYLRENCLRHYQNCSQVNQ